MNLPSKLSCLEEFYIIIITRKHEANVPCLKSNPAPLEAKPNTLPLHHAEDIHRQYSYTDLKYKY